MLKKLPADFKAKWLEALRSGKYEQAHTYLHSKFGFCCLGVACDLHDPETWVKDGEHSFITKGCSASIPDEGDLPHTIIDVITQPYKGGQMVMDHLVTLNDTYRKSFAVIADWIEENL